MCESGAWEARTRICGPTAVMERWRKENKDPAPGTRVHVARVSAGEVSEALMSAPRWWIEQHRPDLLEAWDTANN